MLQNSLRNAIDPWVIGAILLLICIYIFQVHDILRGFNLHDSDDYMRLVQVRDLLDGQAWWSVDQQRLLSPEGGSMHWSRLPDVPLAALILALEPFVSSTRAVELAAIIWPGFLLLIGAGVATALARALHLRGIRLAIAVLLAIAMPGQFTPGRVDHHGFVIVATLAMILGLVSRGPSAWTGALAGAAIAVMLTIAIESLPFAAIGIAAAGLLWTIRGQTETARLRAFGATLAIGGLLAYGLDAPGPFWARRAVCDAYGNAHAAVLVIVGAGYWGLSFLSSRFDASRTHRFLALSCLGALAGLAVLVIQPDCLSDPYAKVDPDAERFWLSNVSEYMGFEAWWRVDKSKIIGVFGYAAAAIAAFALRARFASREILGGWAILLACILGASLLAAWQLRASNFLYAFLAFPTAFVIGGAFFDWHDQRGIGRVVIFAVALFAASPIGWTALARQAAPASERQNSDKAQMDGCWSAAALNALRAIPGEGSQIVFSDVDLGPLVLFATPHRILGAGYHRNGKGIASVFNLLALPVPQSQVALVAAKVDYVLYCNDQGWKIGANAGGENSFGAALIADQAPDWLAPIELPANQADIRLYRVSR